jgi:hypothetical protein
MGAGGGFEVKFTLNQLSSASTSFYNFTQLHVRASANAQIAAFAQLNSKSAPTPCAIAIEHSPTCLLVNQAL